MFNQQTVDFNGIFLALRKINQRVAEGDLTWFRKLVTDIYAECAPMAGVAK